MSANKLREPKSAVIESENEKWLKNSQLLGLKKSMFSTSPASRRSETLVIKRNEPVAKKTVAEIVLPRILADIDDI